MPNFSSSRSMASEVKSGNLYADTEAKAGNEEQLEILLENGGARVERIVSHGGTTGWYDQDTIEFVALLTGSARLQFEGECAERTLSVGDYLVIPKHARHRVTATDSNSPTVWLAFHCR